MKKNTFISIKTQYENLGDAFIIASLLDQVSRRSNVYVDASRCPSDFIECLQTLIPENVNFLRYRGATLIFFAKVFLSRMLNNRTHYFLIPGGFSGEKVGSKYFLAVVYNYLFFIFKAVGVKISQVGMSYDNLGKKHIKILQQRALLLDAHYPRDNLTRSYLEELGISFTGVLPDLAFSQFDGALNKYQKPNGEQNKVIFSFRVDKSLENKTKIKTFIKDVIEKSPNDSTFVFLSQVQRDDQFAKECYDEYSQTKANCQLVLHRNDFAYYFALFNQTKMVFSNRLHCLLIAARFNTPVCPVVNSAENTKIIGIWQDIEHQDDLIYLTDKSTYPTASALDKTSHKIINFDSLNVELENTFDKIYS